jgi:hypothetical protein
LAALLLAALVPGALAALLLAAFVRTVILRRSIRVRLFAAALLPVALRIGLMGVLIGHPSAPEFATHPLQQVGELTRGS